MRNVSRIDMQSASDCIDRDSVSILYHTSCYAFRQLILSGLKIEYNGHQLTHQGIHGSFIHVYNSSTTTLQNSGMCSNGTHRYHSFSVKIYFANITGSFRIGLYAQFYILHISESATIHGDILIHSGKISIHCENECVTGLIYTDTITQWHFDITISTQLHY